jgi:BirA family biotin operon repressor/biotin-[acetyl-CoA-carboxylase] ligase
MSKTYHYEVLESTNIMGKELAAQGAEHGTGVITRKQTAGRGRLGKKWFSAEDGGLQCSIIVRPKFSQSDYHKITLVAGLAVAEVLEGLIKKNAGLKWPNDVKFEGKKCAGILTESSPISASGSFEYAVIGIGVNINTSKNEFPEELHESVTSLYIESGVKTKMEDVYELIRERILKTIAICEGEGFTKIFDQWRRKDILAGKVMECVDVKGKVVRGLCLGMNDDGILHVESPDGIVHEVLSGDVRLAEDHSH